MKTAFPARRDGKRLYDAWRNGYYDPAKADPFDNYVGSTGENPNAMNVGLGAFLQYDSRDVLTSPYKGIFFNLDIKYFPRWLGNSLHTFGKIQVTFDWYQKTWKGCVLAYDLYGNFTMGVPSWHMYSSLGGMERMRGYYEGRYRDPELRDDAGRIAPAGLPSPRGGRVDRCG